MFYELSLPIPKLTPATDPVSDTIPIHPGVIKQVEVILPAGCVALVHLQIFYWEHQLFPSNPDSSFSGDDARISFAEELEIKEPPFELSVRGWNEDDTFDHTPIIRVSLIPFEKDINRLLAQLSIGTTGPITRVGG